MVIMLLLFYLQNAKPTRVLFLEKFRKFLQENMMIITVLISLNLFLNSQHDGFRPFNILKFGNDFVSLFG